MPFCGIGLKGSEKICNFLAQIPFFAGIGKNHQKCSEKGPFLPIPASF